MSEVRPPIQPLPPVQMRIDSESEITSTPQAQGDSDAESSAESGTSGCEADAESPAHELKQWAHRVHAASPSKPKALRKVKRRVLATSVQNMAMLEKMLTSNVSRDVEPPKPAGKKKYFMVDSGSQPNIADCEREFPGHAIRTSEGQKQGLHYKAADGSLIPNEGETDVLHQEPDGEVIKFTFQHARKVHCPVINVKYQVTRDCVVTFHKLGGHIEYPSGRRVSFVCKDGVFFVALNLLPPNCEDAFGRVVNAEPCKPSPGFTRQCPP